MRNDFVQKQQALQPYKAYTFVLVAL